MNLNPAQALDPIFHFLDGIIEEFGVYLFLVLVWLSLFVIAWIFCGGLRRKIRHQPHITTGIGIVILPPTGQSPPTPTIIMHEFDPSQDDDNCYPE